jgi:hypothetical protein
MDQPTLCADGMRNLLDVLGGLQVEGTQFAAAGMKPIIAVISTTGLSKTRDVPLAMLPFYRWMLAVPHEDKKAMEQELVDAAFQIDSPIGGFTVVKSTLHTRGEMKGVNFVRAG